MEVYWMTFGRDFVDRIAALFPAGLVVLLAFKLVAYPAKKAENANTQTSFCRVSTAGKGILCIIGGIWTYFVSEDCFLILLPAGILCACLMNACVMDVESHMVYNYVWWIGTLAGMVLLCQRGWGNILQAIPGLVLYLFLQEGIFHTMYGRADCHGFSVCALFLAGLGLGFAQYLWHMLLTFFLLGIVQLIQKNVTNGGRLKREVPFLPYIVSALGIQGAWKALCK